MLSLCHVTAAQAENYYEKDDYYTQDLLIETSPKTVKSISYWYGNGAETLGLKGQVESAAFKDLLRGKDLQGNCLHARPIDPTKHRAATDYTFSAPKSVSIAGLIQQDTRVIDAHDQAVSTALAILESRYAQARISTPEGRQRIGTGNITAAIFRHETSREQDPQLHSHCVVINTTQLADGTWRSLSNEEVIANQKLLGEIYQNELAYQLQQLGYGVEAKANGQFELIGYGQRLLDTFSTRSQQIKDYIKQWEQDIEQTGGAPLNPKQKKRATLNTRQAKRIIPREVLLKGWAQAIQDQALPPVPQTGQNLGKYSHFYAAIAAQDGIQHAAEREAVFRRSKVERFALEQHLGRQRFSDLTKAISQVKQLILLDNSQTKYTTQMAIDRERDTLRLMQGGQQQVNAIANATDIMELFNTHSTLTNGQRQAIELSLTTHDRIIAWQGVAGAGKTYSLKLVAKQSEEQGYIVRGFAPSAEAANVLGKEAGIQSDTVASLLKSKAKPIELLGKEIWIVDEAGLLSTRDAHALLQKAAEQQARVILVGDTRQLSAVEAGNPFRALQAAGIATAQLDQSLRQKDAHLKAAVEAIAKGDLESGFHHLDQANSIRAVQSQEERISAIAQDYLTLTPDQRQKTLIIANTNAERRSITQTIRQGLQVEGYLVADTFTLTSLKPRNLTTVQAKYAKNYELGDILMPMKDYRKSQLAKGQQYEVIAINTATNRLTVTANDGQRLEIDPSRCESKTIYQTDLIPLAAGDQLRWTRNDRNQGRRNGQVLTIDKLDDQGQAIVRDADGKTACIDLSGRQFADYAIVSTTYSSQGKTADRVLAALDQTTGKESFYVAASRAKHELVIYTTDAAELRKLTAQSRANENASDYVNLFTYQPQRGNHAQNEIKPTETHRRTATYHSTDRGVSIGSRASGRLATALPGDRRLETSADTLHRNLEQFGRQPSVAGIDPNAVAQAITEFVAQQTLIRSGVAITATLESVTANLRQLERLSQQFAERDRALEEIKPTQPTPGTPSASTNPLALDQVATLTPEAWSQLTPRQQIILAQAAQAHNRNEPSVCTQPEQWRGQAASLQKELVELSDRLALEQATLQALEQRGERSLFNPLGASFERIHDASRQLAHTRAVWECAQREIAAIKFRHAQRQREEKAHQQWLSKPQSQGAQHIAKLLQQPEVKSHYDSMLRTFNELQCWQEAAESLGYGAQKVSQIKQVKQHYLDGHGLSEPVWEQMQYDLDLVKEQQRQLKRQQQMEM
jgi:conjugative relaxase-like TrwC/TraI family protein